MLCACQLALEQIVQRDAYDKATCKELKTTYSDVDNVIQHLD